MEPKEEAFLFAVAKQGIRYNLFTGTHGRLHRRGSMSCPRFNMKSEYDVIVIGSGLGGLTAGAMLGQYGRKVLVLESHYAAGGAAHGFEVDGFKFDTGPSFFCGMTETGSLNPVKMVLSALGETLPCVSYDKFIYHFPSDKVELPVFGDWERYLDSVRSVSQTGARQLQRLRDETMDVYQALKGIPTMAIRADWKAVPLLLSRYPMGMLRTAKFSQGLQEPFEKLTRKAGVTDPLVSRLIDLECFLLSGLKASGTVTAEMVFMFGERECRAVEYPKNGAVALVDALVRGNDRNRRGIRCCMLSLPSDTYN